MKAYVNGGSAPRLPEMQLRQHCRLNRSDVQNCGVLLVDDGMLALEATPLGGKRQILDFVMAGDVIMPSLSVNGCFNVRAITAATLRTDKTENDQLIARLGLQFARRNLHQILIGQLEAEGRIASFLMALAIRSHGSLEPGIALPLSMTRDDIADYLVINPDTLSRIMVRFETSGIIRRINRHCVELVDDKALQARTPLRNALFSTLIPVKPQPETPTALSLPLQACEDRFGPKNAELRRAG